jgi:hypothetical protein
MYLPSAMYAPSGRARRASVLCYPSVGHSHVNTDWVVGSGTEGKLLIPGWTYKIEALYMDLGTLDATGSGGSFNAISKGVFGSSSAGVTAGPVHTHPFHRHHLARPAQLSIPLICSADMQADHLVLFCP